MSDVIWEGTKKTHFASIIILAILLTASYSYAGIYWVSNTGAASWSNCSGTTPLSGIAACTLKTANSNASAGDIVNMRAGNYHIGGSTATGKGSSVSDLSPGIIPANSGSAANLITWKPYSTEVVNFVGHADIAIASRGIWINGKSHIKVTGTSLGQFNISKMQVNILIGPWPGQSPSADSSHNEISYVHSFDSYRIDASWSRNWQGSLVWGQAFYNHIHHCKFEKHGFHTKNNGGKDNEGNLFDLGVESANTAAKKTSYNVIENNEFLHGGHGTFGWFGDHNVVRNNYFHNEGWYEIDGGYYGYRNIIGDGFPGYVGYNIFEGNRIGHAAPNYTYVGKTWEWGGTGMKLCHPYNILRYNSFFSNSSTTISLGTYFTGGAMGDHNYFYNNTFYKNGRYEKLPLETVTNYLPIMLDYSTTYSYSIMEGSVFKNNLFFGNASTSSSSRVWGIPAGGTLSDAMNPNIGNVTIESNMNGGTSFVTETDPKFTDTSLTNYSSWTLPNLNLQPTSPAINAASHLTQATNSGSSSTALVVGNARYFQDGNFGTGTTLTWPSSVIMAADWIAIGTVSNVVQIKSINYSTNTITLVAPKSWNNGAPIWLYKKSDTAKVIYGKAPDMGAHESKYLCIEGEDCSSPSKPAPFSVKRLK